MIRLAKTLRLPALLGVGLTFIVGSVFAGPPYPTPTPTPTPTSTPAPLPHFKCYQLGEKGGALNEPVTLTDQFHTEYVKVKNPHFLCGPVTKTHCTKDNYGRNVCLTETVDLEGPHLLCWKIAPSGPPVGEEVTSEGSQFEDRTVKVQTGQLLCEPVLKKRY
ncbi:MAG: DUF7450 family protein [bacterium]